MPKRPPVPLTEIRLAIQQRRIIEFDYAGVRWTVEPHELAQAVRHSLVVQAWVLDGPTKTQWMIFRYAEMRALQVSSSVFPQRKLPPVLLDWRGPDQSLRRVRYAPPQGNGPT
jgi:hypothetical protein